MPGATTEVATVSTVGPGGLTARVKRQGQAVESIWLKVAAGVTGLTATPPASRVVLTRLGGSLNSAYISAKL